MSSRVKSTGGTPVTIDAIPVSGTDLSLIPNSDLQTASGQRAVWAFITVEGDDIRWGFSTEVDGSKGHLAPAGTSILLDNEAQLDLFRAHLASGSSSSTLQVTLEF